MSKIVLPKGYKPTEDEEYMNPMQLEYFKQILLAWQENINNGSRETLDHLQKENWHEPDFNDRALTESVAAFNLRRSDRERKLLYKIQQALERIEKAEYGYCEKTGEPIGLKRLEARPIATMTIEAQERHESYESKHNEEDIEE